MERCSASDSLFIKSGNKQKYSTYFENVAQTYEQYYDNMDRTQPLYSHKTKPSPRMKKLPEHNLCNSPQNSPKKRVLLHKSQLL